MTAQATAQSDAKTSRLQALSTAFAKALPRVRDFLVHAVFQLRMFQKPYPLVMHKLIYIGVTLQVVGTIINILNMLLFFPWTITFPRGNAYLVYELV
ncbi:MAG TPA: hypothetical protein VF831_01310, partial [Anaerolineales bacterium]